MQPDYFKIETQQLYYGRLLNEIDEIEKRKVCLIGAKVNEVLFKGNDPCGKYIRVNGIYYQVVGVTKQRASSVNIGGRAEESVFLPFSTMQQTLNQGDIIHFLCVSAKPGYKIDPVITQIKDIVKSRDLSYRPAGRDGDQLGGSVRDFQYAIYRYRYLDLARGYGYVIGGYYRCK